MRFGLHDPQLGFLLGLFIGHTRSNEEVLVIDAAVGEGHEADVHEPTQAHTLYSSAPCVLLGLISIT